MIRIASSIALLIGFVTPVAAGPISVFTQVWETGGGGSDELHLSGLGSWCVLTTGGGVNPLLTVSGDQNSASGQVVGFWPVLNFRDYAQYEAQRGTVLTIPNTHVTLYAEVWNGAYGGATSQVQQVFIDAVISGTLGVRPGENSLDWQFLNPPTQVTFGQTTVTLTYTPVQMPDGVPHIQFEDGSPPIGFPGAQYYPTLLEAQIDVQRASNEPSDPSDPPVVELPGEQPPVTGTPEPTSALLLAGFAVCGLAARARAMRKS